MVPMYHKWMQDKNDKMCFYMFPTEPRLVCTGNAPAVQICGFVKPVKVF